MNCFNIVVFLLKSFSVTVGTIFHHTNLELQKWFLAIALILNAKKGISTRQLAKYHDLAEHIIKNVEMGSTLITDEHSSCRTLKTYYKHKTICHSAKEYISKDDIHTKSIESFWSLLKREIKGNFRHISKKYLQAYINEFSYRYNARKLENVDVFNDVVARLLGC